MITDAELNNLRIKQFIFHVVHHGPEEPELLDEVPIGDFEPFFLDRARDTLRGNAFEFLAHSETRRRLGMIDKTPATFVEISKELAQDFHKQRDKRIKPGVFILMRLTSRIKTFFLVIKYEHERVVAYEIEKHRAILHEIKNSFTQSPSALQKSAFIRLSRVGGDLVVIDRTIRKDITDFFRDFLGVRRKYDAVQMSEKVAEAVYETVRAHQADLPPAFAANWRNNLDRVASKRKVFDADDFVNVFFGAEATEDVRETFTDELTKRELKDEVFDFDRNAFKVSGITRYRTYEGVAVQVPAEARDFVKVENLTDRSRIIITTKRVVERL